MIVRFQRATGDGSVWMVSVPRIGRADVPVDFTTVTDQQRSFLGVADGWDIRMEVDITRP
jgi:hypothetical protein